MLTNPTVTYKFNLQRFYREHVKPEDIEIGNRWYFDANNTCYQLAKKYNTTINKVCAVVAVLSPGVRWEQTLLDAERLIRTILLKRSHIAKVSTYNPNRLKAIKILRAENFGEYIGGNKVNSFYANLVDPTNYYTVTLDRWMFRITTNDFLDKNTARLFAAKPYAIIEGIFVELSKEFGFQYAHQFQATLWTAVKRIVDYKKGVKHA